MIKPDYISYKDWELLNDKYSSKELEEYFNKNYPYQYLIGDVEFCNNKILVDERVLIPRFETEIMVNEVIKYINSKDKKDLRIADVCTGSGCIAISLKKEFPEATVCAIDVSSEALDLARENAKLNEVDVKYFCHDVLKEDIDISYDIVVSNPPYVKHTEKVGESTKYEPQIALFADDEGLIFYDNIIRKFKSKYYAFEIGNTQKEQVINIIKKYYPQAKLECKKDYSGFDRFIYVINE